jgi:RNA polymerase sigma factor for flagellar operon FliA
LTDEGVTVEGSPDVLDAQAPAALWDDWTIRRDEAARQQLVTHYGAFARILAARAFSNRFSLELEFDDYLQFALLGLLEAVDRFDPARGVPFEAYASRRINGAVLSGVETLSEKQAQISARSQARKDRARSLAKDGAPEANTQADPLQRLADIAVGLALGVMLEGATVYVSGDPSDSSGTPYDRVVIAQLRARLRRLVDQLPEQERRVLHHHYYQQVPFEEIAREAGLTKGRISQIHHAALRRLRQLGADDDNVLLVT